MSCSQSFASARSSDATSSSVCSTPTKASHSFLDDFSFLLLQFLVQEDEVPPGSTTSSGAIQPITPALISLQAVLHAAARTTESTNADTSPFSVSASAEMFLLRLKQLLERRVHEKQATLLAQRLSTLVDHQMHKDELSSLPPVSDAVLPVRPSSLPPSTACLRRRSHREGTSSSKYSLHTSLGLVHDERSSSGGSPTPPECVVHDDNLGYSSAVPNPSNAEDMVTGPHDSPWMSLSQLHGDLLLCLQQHLCESMLHVESIKNEHGGFGGVIFPARAHTLQHELLAGVGSVLAGCRDIAIRQCRSGRLRAASLDNFLRELAQSRRRIDDALRQDGCVLAVHELTPAGTGGLATSVETASSAHSRQDGDDGIDLPYGSAALRSRLGQDDADFVHYAIQQHLWLLWRTLRQRFSAYPNWDLLERAYRFVTLPSKSPSPFVPVGGGDDNSAVLRECASTPTQPMRKDDREEERESADTNHDDKVEWRAFASPPPPSDDVDAEKKAMTDTSTPFRPPPAVAHTQTKHRSPLAERDETESPSLAPSEDAVPLGRVRRVTQKPAPSDVTPAAHVLCTLAALEHKLPKCSLYDGLLSELRSISC